MNFRVLSAVSICKDSHLVYLMMSDPAVTLIRSGASGTATSLRQLQ